ncbi:MAG: cytochrome c [Gammaproteobacteria bacterium]|nr:cytochrome c [Gammaproteobacteria bacterium]
MHKTLLIILTTIIISGCTKTNEFTPKEGADSESIFKLACAECHNPVGGQIFILSKDRATIPAISKQINEGSMTMPSFPNIKSETLSNLAQYVIDNSKVE